MKKLTLKCLALLSVMTLVACSTDASVEKTQETTTAHSSSSTSSSMEVSSVDNSKYDAVINELKSSIDPENTGQISVEVENNVIDSEYPDGHDVIRVLLIGDIKDSAQESLDAVYSNSANTEQSNAITMFRMMISELAKKLPDDTTTIDFGIEKSPDQYQLIAKSSKTTDIIPVGELLSE